MHSDQLCRHCSRSVPGDQVIALWDGHVYCRACVEAVSPELARYARSHDTLEETASFDRRAVWRNALRMEALIILAFGTLFCIYGYSVFGSVGIAYGLGMTFILCGAQAATQLPVFIWVGRRLLPTVIVKNGNLECFRGGRKNRCLRSMPLQDATWRIGKSRKDTGLRNTFIQRQEVVLIVLRVKVGRLTLGSDRYACGWTDEMRHIWIAFLTLAGVQRVG